MHVLVVIAVVMAVLGFFLYWLARRGSLWYFGALVAAMVTVLSVPSLIAEAMHATTVSTFLVGLAAFAVGMVLNVVTVRNDD